MTDWNYADTWETVARTRPDAEALVQGPRRLTWAELDRRADGIAAALLDAGLGHQAKVAQYLYNCPEYIESFFAAMKAGMVPVNTNYRYTADELVYLWDNADVEAVVFDRAFVGRVEEVRARLPRVKLWLVVDGAAPETAVPEWARSYEALATGGGPRQVQGPWGRSGDDLILIYTGGTTGMPKGVMWRQDDLWAILNRTATLRYPEDGTIDDVAGLLAAPPKRTPPRLLPGPPLMHGTGMFSAITALASGGALAMPPGHKFSPTEVLDTIERERVTELVIVGDAFARPLLDALDADPGRWDLSSLWLVLSSGVMWSAEVRAGLLRHHPGLMLVDTLGSSEAIGMASSRSSTDGAPSTAGFRLSEQTRVVAPDGSDVRPGSGEMGLVALRGRGSIGYYKDEAKTAATYRIIDGERWSIPGDWATIEADGTVRLLGRGSVCINTGGEKVFPEEVEEALKRHPAVADAVVVGVPDPRFNEVVVAMVEWRPAADGTPPPPGDELVAWVRETLADYKSPRHVVTVGSIGRAANGKVDYRGLRTAAMAELGVPASAG
ncbi:AMP-binding protein [Acidiferrimicrobium sp. IK]|uniref:AMP-binding protein n=1 Tax=Acidiferrimicrobium sp. IK TaxID=2871700 RepID=UPI0021CAEE0D|nr:AMP-binding protein [Acidiferrimicrobium sp. IK]MCU4184360.1 AMP-binding protein [Acidiferrimicrobium sp. IK]